MKEISPKYWWWLIAVGVFLLCMSIKCISGILPNNHHFTDANDLSEIRNTIDSYYINQKHDRSGVHYTIIFVLINGDHYWTNAVNKDTANNILKAKSEVRFYVNPHSTAKPIDGAAKSYGLWVSGQQIKSLDSALKQERSNYYFARTSGILLALCLVFVGMVFIYCGWILKKRASMTFPP
jgi:hypothetical protein